MIMSIENSCVMLSVYLTSNHVTDSNYVDIHLKSHRIVNLSTDKNGSCLFNDSKLHALNHFIYYFTLIRWKCGRRQMREWLKKAALMITKINENSFCCTNISYIPSQTSHTKRNSIHGTFDVKWNELFWFLNKNMLTWRKNHFFY